MFGVERIDMPDLGGPALGPAIDGNVRTIRLWAAFGAGDLGGCIWLARRRGRELDTGFPAASIQLHARLCAHVSGELDFLLHSDPGTDFREAQLPVAQPLLAVWFSYISPNE